jgi:hydrogenase maturation protease
MKTLVAGVGNIFLTDDGFGVEVAGRMAGRALPEGVELVDFGIRGVHLAYQLLEGYDRLVLIDAAPHGQPPGSVSLLQVDQDQVVASAPAVAEGQSPLVDAHGLEPGAILGMLGSLGGQVAEVLVVACEPESLDEGLGLTPVVEAAVPHGIRLVEEVLGIAEPQPEHHDARTTDSEVSR